jgi:hypothetical protein
MQRVLENNNKEKIMHDGRNIVGALLAGVIAFVVTFIVILIVAAIFEAVGLANVAEVLERFNWIISLLVGLVTGLNRYRL